MKKLSSLFLVFLFIQLTTVAQEGWFNQTSGTSSPLYSVYFVNQNYGWITGESNVIKKSTDGGQSWNNTAFHGSSASIWYCIRFVNDNEGYAAGCTYIVDRYISNWALTTNGGNSWEWQTSWGNDYSSTRAVFFLNENLGWTVGPRNGTGPIYKTTTGITGFSWFSGRPEPLYSIHFVDADKGWCVGSNGVIYVTSNGGNDWTAQNSGTTKMLKSVCFINSANGWAVGYGEDQAIILKTTNGGDTWNNALPPSVKKLNSVTFINENTGWSCGRMASTPNDNGVILFTSDGGINWQEQYVDSSCAEFYEIDILNNTTGWVVGSGGTLLKTSTGGIVFRDENNTMPTAFNLEQNFPNPFNPNTTIKYSIPKLSFVTIKIYDVLGSEVAGLVNEEKLAGVYEVNWNATNLSSGVYFYKLQAGSFVETMKMILLK
jgi:photosystem II stability/assembly factor-like uncharacterized protein